MHFGARILSARRSGWRAAGQGGTENRSGRTPRGGGILRQTTVIEADAFVHACRRGATMLHRREFITLLAGATAAWPLAAHAQRRSPISKVGVLWHAANAEEEGPLFKGLLEGFRILDYVEGRNISLEHRFPNEIPGRFKKMAADLVALNVDALVGAGTQAALALRDATKTIPIVFMFLPDPVATKLVDSLGRPGGNVTGLSNFSSDLIGKRLQLLKEAIPGLSRLALLVNPDSQISRRYIDVARAAAPGIGLAIQTFEVRLLDEFEPAFDAMAKAGMQAVGIKRKGLIYQGRELIARLALARHMALVAYSRETFEAGALMSYGPDNIVATHRAAALVDKILKGIKPADLPVEEPTKFELVINLKTAKSFGLTIPPSLLARADQGMDSGPPNLGNSRPAARSCRRSPALMRRRPGDVPHLTAPGRSMKIRADEWAWSARLGGQQ